ncbi:aminotransferase class I/II-fold pyridoxal phosphate-dependent enzyme [Vallicoccus soli]|uniref:Aminotransferase class I/II-fold pyridoxal phosphate-dependent enzyme n=1 Tax=Vallicoccus soli TaxID=2339232 RepID=A0A3A3Z1F2_9ACTN|nr:aminotransferase class I/II-fold pyridoxal phosphate-dependent enzyme [Vallicoccus soli]RJK98080.1 aminotransferase class I/II-fold pyridoxal phosphate-dependent enzyme [Vallicoccus soli]
MTVRYRISGAGSAEIAASVEAAVADGHLVAGDPLPPVRALAADLGVAPGTVATAYATLRDRGVVETAGRRGTRVRERSTATPRWQRGAVVPPGARDLSGGGPATDLLPPLAARARGPVRYGDPDVAPRLEAAARGLLAREGVPDGPLAVVSGALDGVERVLLAALRPGDRVAVEDPGWGNLLDLVAALGLVADPVPVDDEGPDPAAVERALRRGARAVLVTARAQNPTGAAVTAERARALRAVLAAHPDALLVEDDHAAEVSGAPLHPLSGAAPRWALVRSVSKAWGPDLRVALLTGEAALVERVRARQRLGAGWVSRLLQDAVVDLWEDPAATALVQGAARRYAARRGALLAALAGHGVRAHGASGLNAWLPVADETAAVTALLADGWGVAPGARFRLRSGPGVRVTVTGLREDEVAPLAAALAAAARGGGRTGA